MNNLNKEKYVPLKEIGRGTFGVAIKAHCRTTGSTVVIKMIDCSKLTPRQENDAINELNVLRRLKHPYVVTHKDNFSEFGTLSIVMEYATGGDLYSRIKAKSLSKGASFSELEIVTWFVQMLKGVSYIHSRNIMHRDLKPQNLFLTSDGLGGEKILIGDFGVCKVMRSSVDLTSTVTGTPYYLSPEVFQKKPYSMKSDVWSLGCVLFELAALQVPFDAPDLHALEAKVTRGPNPRFPVQFSHELRDVFLATIRRDYRTRPSPAELLESPFLVAPANLPRPPSELPTGQVSSANQAREEARGGSPQVRVSQARVGSPQVRVSQARVGSPQIKVSQARVGSPQVRVKNELTSQTRVGSPQVRVKNELTSQTRVGSPQIREGPTSQARASSPHMREDPRIQTKVKSTHNISDKVRESSPGIRTRIANQLRVNSPGLRLVSSPRVRQCSPAIRQSSPGIRQEPKCVRNVIAVRQRSPSIRQDTSSARKYSPGIIQNATSVRQHSPGICLTGDLMNKGKICSSAKSSERTATSRPPFRTGSPMRVYPASPLRQRLAKLC